MDFLHHPNSFWDQRETELFCAGPDSVVEAQQREVRNRATTEDRARHVQGVQGADRLTGKGLTGACDDVGANAKDVPVCCCVEQTPTAGLGSFLGDFVKRSRTDDHALAFYDGQIRCKYDVRAT